MIVLSMDRGRRIIAQYHDGKAVGVAAPAVGVQCLGSTEPRCGVERDETIRSGGMERPNARVN